MTSVKDLHREAMQQADLGHAARREGSAEDARRYFEEAYRLERAGAEQLLSRFESEPSRSILFRSAATLAMEATRFTEAEQMVCMALAGTPPDGIAEELRDLFEQITFRRHLLVRGVNLEEREIQMSLFGPGVGHGIAPTDAVLERIEHTQSLMFRFTERKLDRAYRDKGPPPRDIRQAVSLFMTVPRAASFAVSLVVGGVQETFPGMYFGAEVIDEVVECLALFEHEEERALRDKIRDEAYLTNFKALAKAIAPDGKEISGVGFTARRDGAEKTVALRRIRGQQAPASDVMVVTSSRQINITVTGTLRFADAMEERQNLIKLLDEQGKQHTIIVPPGMMDDIVRPLWDYRVSVTGARVRWGRIILEDIVKAQD